MNQKFLDFLHNNKLEFKVVDFPESTRTAADAAATLGCDIAQIAKSIIFKSGNGEAVLVITSGVNRVDIAKIEIIIDFPVSKADADFVKAETLYTIGGVPPFAFEKSIRTIIDEDLMQYQVIWAAAGTPNSVFSLTPMDLVRMTKAPVYEVKV
jgi:prolyl-tRNA editing enzyme YbaK/EbsC (Cys-tRNA(Pro) deacylase)